MEIWFSFFYWYIANPSSSMFDLWWTMDWFNILKTVLGNVTSSQRKFNQVKCNKGKKTQPTKMERFEQIEPIDANLFLFIEHNSCWFDVECEWFISNVKLDALNFHSDNVRRKKWYAQSLVPAHKLFLLFVKSAFSMRIKSIAINLFFIFRDMAAEIFMMYNIFVRTENRFRKTENDSKGKNIAK